MNNVQFIARMTDDVTLTYTPAGVAIGKFTLAVQRKFKNKDGEYDADFPRCVTFNKTAEFAASKARKGKRVAVTGRLQTGSYDDKEGKRIYTTDIVVEDIEIIDWPEKVAENEDTGTAEPDWTKGEKVPF